MTESNRATNIAEELSRARECLREADLLDSGGMNSGAVSRLYYFVFHAIRALLLSKSLEPRSHDGALRLLSLHFVKNGSMDSSISHIFTRLMKYRSEADYNASYVFTSQDYKDFRSQAEELFAVVVTILGKTGYRDS